MPRGIEKALDRDDSPTNARRRAGNSAPSLSAEPRRREGAQEPRDSRNETPCTRTQGQIDRAKLEQEELKSMMEAIQAQLARQELAEGTGHSENPVRTSSHTCQWE